MNLKGENNKNVMKNCSSLAYKIAKMGPRAMKFCGVIFKGVSYVVAKFENF
ncbi:unnamed protein product [Meloidogyne enterolobii]|uniref:Uncharacterized protein n=1 Tax=Meloidogyne enterolobii TaxID=390850 RepID=A0ACB0YQ63_MELEN